MRLTMESRKSHSTTFVTLTYQDSEIPYFYTKAIELQTFSIGGPEKIKKVRHIIKIYGNEPTVRKDHLQKFINRVRKNQDSNKSLKKNWKRTCETLGLTDTEIKKIRFYAVGEYGGRFKRPHYHITFFNLYSQTLNNLQKLWTDPNTNNPYGTIHIMQVDTGYLNYISKYHINKHALINDPKNLQRQPPFALMSRMPALGTEGILDQKQSILDTDTLTINGISQQLPQIFKDKIYPNEWAQIDLKARKQAFAKLGELRTIRKLQKEGFTRPLLEMEKRAEAQNKLLIRKAKKS